ncbi:MAG: hypothetical protein K8S56_04070 [Candidatus Cloacimonetes bacterium]|nr:hypothetical protein [Candidatus Cloacimonadota bacterium]
MIRLSLFLIVAILLSGCTGRGTLQVINRTSHQVYYTFKGHDYELSIGETGTATVNIRRDWSPFTDDGKVYTLGIEGETYLIDDDVYQTQVELKPSKTLKVYADPYYACLRVTNLSDSVITGVYYIKYKDRKQDTSNNLIEGNPLYYEDSFFEQLEYNAPQDPVSYDFMIFFQGGGSFTDYNIILGNDELHLIEVTSLR